MLDRCRLIVESEPRDGRWNMAIDEALLESVLAGNLPVIRWYQWKHPTLSLGYFQSAAEVEAEPRWTGIDKVRRLTGGGAILHDREWTYSCVVPVDQQLVKHPYDLYDIVHEAVISWFKEEGGIDLALRGQSTRAAEEPALCFFRQDSHDVCYQGRKVLGSAQRRRRGVLLQHGSLIWGTSSITPEIVGLQELCGQDAFLDRRIELADAVVRCIAERVLYEELSASELAAASEFAATRYASIERT